MIQRRIGKDEVVVGQPLPWNVYDEHGTLLLAEGGVVPTLRQLNRLIDSGYYLVDTGPPGHIPTLSARQRLSRAHARLASLLDPPESAPVFPAQVLDIAYLIEQAYLRHPGVAIASIALYQTGRYAVRHSLNTACAVVAVLHAMNRRDTDNLSVLAAALTMNLGMLDLHDILAQQAQPPTPSQRARIDVHPFDSVARLRSLGVENELWLRAVQEHHEAWDGSGYPLHLRGNQVAPEAQLIGLADVFCARVSERGFSPADSPKIVLRDLLLERGQRYEPTLAAYFIRALGVYPIGTVVALANGELGVVSEHTDKVDTPIVHAIQRAGGGPLEPPRRYLTDVPAHVIVRELGAAELNVPVDMEAIWGYEARDFPLRETVGTARRLRL